MSKSFDFAAITKDKENLKKESKKLSETPKLFVGSDVAKDTNGQAYLIELNKIKKRAINDFNLTCLDSLKESIKISQLVHPIAVKDNLDGTYTIISGHRRFEAYNELYAETGDDTYSRIPATVYEVVSKNDVRLGTDRKYITNAQEEHMYKSANLENRQLSKDELVKHISYFYDQINNNDEYKNKILERRKKTSKYNTKTIDVPRLVAAVITEDLGFNIGSTYIYQVVKILDDAKNNKQKSDQAIKQIIDGGSVKTIYNEYFNITSKVENKVKEKQIPISTVESLLTDIVYNRITAKEALKRIQKL